MIKLSTLAAAAALGFAGAAMLAPDAEARHPSRGWNGPEGYFVVNAAACPDLRDDRRGRGYGRHHRGYNRYGRHHRGHDRRDRRILRCPEWAWDYVPSYRERRMGRTGDRLRPDSAYWSRRGGGYYVDTRWGPVRVEVRYGRGRHHGYGRHTTFRFRY